MFFTRRARTYSMAASSRTPDGAFPSSWIADGNRSLWKGHECDEQGGEPADVVEVAVGDEEVANPTGRDARSLELPK